MMDMKLKNKSRPSYAFLRIVSKTMDIDKKARYFRTDQPLYEAEIHMLKAIKENEGIHVTGLADILGVTKGAVSQTLMKLQRKGMVVKETDPANLSRLTLKLTPKGETAYLSHEELHRKYEKVFSDILADYSEANKAFLWSFFSMLEEKLDKFME
ncbi:MarR family transcriptional regulator [Pyramidobacter sp. SM-530-WT-4B]|uniref:MarR family transcriptional regulator n=2 Tax=Pyramidobacter porci TaxID=2605789 RepID=A0A6L5YBK8_9BACT|nr:MarR family transcriptional regulator [Pyramidobacter porci]